MTDRLVLLFAPDAADLAIDFRLELLKNGIQVVTLAEIILTGPIDVSLVAKDTPGVIIVLSNGLAADTLSCTLAQKALEYHKGFPVALSDETTTPNWSPKPFTLFGDMAEIHFKFLVTRVQSALSLAELGNMFDEAAVESLGALMDKISQGN